MAKTLTAVSVKNYRAGSARREISDGGCPGLYLVVQASGHKSFAMRFRRPDGKPAKLVLGPVDLSSDTEGEPVIGQPLTLAAARRLAADVNRHRAMGRDVRADHIAAKRRQKFEQATRAASTFGAAARDFVEGHVKKRTRRWQAMARMLGLDPALEPVRGGLADRWSDKPLADIDGHDVYAVVDEARQRGVPGMGRRTEGASESRARHLFATLSVTFGWLVQHRRIDKNPCNGVHRPDPPEARDRVLTDAETTKFWRATDDERFGPLLRLLLLTGCRLNEVSGMRRAELSDDGATWTIPGARTKNKKTHVVPLSPLAREIISNVPGQADLIFTTTGTTPVSGWSKIKTRLDDAMKIPPWRLHDLRRTCATGMAEIGVAPHIVEAALNHISGAKAGVAGTYNRAAYAGEKKIALERWADHIASLVAGKKAKNVVPMRRVPS